MSTQSGQYCKRKETGLNFRIFFSLLWQLETESTKKICSGSNQPSSVTALSILKTVRLRLWPKKNCSALASPNSSAPALVPAKTARLRRWYQPKQLCSGSGQPKQLGSGSGTSQNMQLCSGSALFEKYWRIRCMWLMMLLQALCDVKLNRGKCSKF